MQWLVLKVAHRISVSHSFICKSLKLQLTCNLLSQSLIAVLSQIVKQIPVKQPL